MSSHRRVEKWLGMDRQALDEVYRNTAAGTMPAGDTRGTAIVAGSLFARCYARFARLFGWQGKVFDLFADGGQSGILVNKITPLSLTFIVAKVYRGPSWMDEQETIIIDYASTSFFARYIRDEIREVEPGVYLGKVWWGKTRILDFALTGNDG